MVSIFTEIIEGKRPGFIIFEDETHVAILDKYPIDTGHSLVIPKKPYEKITDMPKNEVAELFSCVPEIANAILKATGAVAFSCLLYTSPSPRDATLSRMPSSA